MRGKTERLSFSRKCRRKLLKRRQRRRRSKKGNSYKRKRRLRGRHNYRKCRAKKSKSTPVT